MFFFAANIKQLSNKNYNTMKQYLIMAVIGIAAAVVTNKWIMPKITGNY